MSTLVLPISGLPWGHLKNKNWLISSHLRGLGGGHNICYVWGDFCCDFCIRSCRWGQAPCPPLAPSWPQSQASLLTGLTCEGWLTFVLIFFFTSPVLFTSFSFFNLFFVDPRTTAAASACSSANQRQYKVRVSGKMQLLQKNFEGNSPTQNRLTGQKQLLKRKEAALVTLWGAECQTL